MRAALLWLACAAAIAGARRVLNDDYCDDQTGTDEPLTAACSSFGSQGSFKCARPRPQGTVISPSKVHDTVCDCCDGSDEPASQNCPNTCDAIEAQIAEAEQRERRLREQGEAAFRTLLAQSNTCPQDVAKLKQSIDELREKKKTMLEEEAKLRGELAAQRVKDMRLSELSREQLERLVIDLATTAVDGGETLEGLMKDILCPNGQDEASESENQEDREGDEEGTATAADDDDENETRENCVVWQVDAESQDSEAVKEKIAQADKEISSLQTLIDSDGGATDYGPGRVWLSLKDECVSATSDKYTYEVCFFKQAKQDAVLLGSWKEWRDGYKEMSFTGGQHCYATNAPRTMTVFVVCGLENRLSDIREPSTCSYSGVLHTPAACVPENFQAEATQCAR